MKRVWLVLTLVIGLSVAAEARQGTSIAALVGVPTGLNFKSWITESVALNANFAFNLLYGMDKRRNCINVDILAHWEPLYNAPFYVGGGPRYEIDTALKNDNYLAGIRTVAGQEIFIKQNPVSFFYEGAVILDIWTRLEVNWNASIGLRYYLSR